MLAPNIKLTKLTIFATLFPFKGCKIPPIDIPYTEIISAIIEKITNINHRFTRFTAPIISAYLDKPVVKKVADKINNNTALICMLENVSKNFSSSILVLVFATSRTLIFTSFFGFLLSMDFKISESI